MHCGRFQRPIDRREMLLTAANGFGGLALTALFGGSASAETSGASARRDPLAPKAPHFAAKAKSVIFLFMDGGPSQVDTFDPKPRLHREHGSPIKIKTEPTQFNNVGNVLESPWAFRPRGKSGIPVSDLLPHMGEWVDEMAVIRSMVSDFSEHTAANYFMHTGSGLQGRPSHGAWVTYGLGSEAEDLPGFVVLNSGLIPPGGVDCFGSAFLPASFQGSIFKAGANAVANLAPAGGAEGQRRRLDLIARLDRETLARSGSDDAIESAVANYELAFKMQSAVPGLTSIDGESKAVRELYGLDDEYAPTRLFGRQCLIARRMVERGVRFVEVLCPSVGSDRWDQHNDLRKGHADNARAVDKPVAALLRDLKARGLLESTLVFWGGEFGRTPMAQGTDGRDHNPFGFTVWLAGGGIKGGTIHGETDDYGYRAIRDQVKVHDLHATMLHLLGLDHTKTTFRFGGRDMRLTEVFGEVVHDIIA
ncbi:MAG: DUF1501 domain-containing protein [Isosphaeraceae bacterium]|nr:DUF1501 domain-containing protein [Isosphaeraceae bacterium]